MHEALRTMIALLVCAAGAIAQIPAAVQLDAIREDATYIYKFVISPFGGPETLSPESAAALLERARQCIARLDKAGASGISSVRTVDVRYEIPSKAGVQVRPMSLDNVRAMCKKVISDTGGKTAKAKAAQAVQQIAVWPKLLADGAVDEVQARAALDVGTLALAQIDEARADGLSDADTIEAMNRRMTVAEGRELILYVRGEAKKIVDKNKAAEEAAYEPFRQVLTGDKLKLYNERLKAYKLYGSGGRVLRTPEDYLASAIWCTAGVNRDGIVPRWELDCWHFRGMTQIGGVTSRSGAGEFPPSGAFR